MFESLVGLSFFLKIEVEMLRSTRMFNQSLKKIKMVCRGSEENNTVLIGRFDKLQWQTVNENLNTVNRIV